MANLVAYKNGQTNSTAGKPLFKGATKNSSAKNVKYTISNKNTFTENHNYFGVFSKSYFKSFVKALTNKQRLELWLFFNNLSNGIEMKISDVRYTKKDNISYVKVSTTYEGETKKFDMFYFHGLHKLLSFASFVKFNLDLKGLLIEASKK